MNTTKQVQSLSAFSLITDSGPFVKLILILLLFASILTWAIIFTKMRIIKNAQNENKIFLDTFWNAKALDEVDERMVRFPASPTAQVFHSGYKELRKFTGNPDIVNIERALNRAHSIQVDELEKYVDWLASTASAAPFIGLFGTVWGIMSSFQSIGAMGSASLAVVAPGISEALISTAVGLAAAIPAAIFYNFILGKMKRLSLEMENFSQDFLNMVQRSMTAGAP